MKFIVIITTLIISYSLRSQSDSTGGAEKIYDRPLRAIGSGGTAIGGYMEGNSNYFVTDGITEGLSFEFRRFNIFLFSPIHQKIKFFSELEFEHGTREIALETAQLDLLLNPAFNLRAGIILVPLGNFNQNHDSPKWNFIERPLSSTLLIPSTFSEAGAGIYGKLYPGTGTFYYEFYLSNGLSDEIVFNEEGKTFIPSGKKDEILAEDNNGSPAVSGKIGIKTDKSGELGLSAYSGVYNTFRKEGVELESKRKVWIAAADYQIRLNRISFIAEASMAGIEIPSNAGASYGSSQIGFFSDIIYTFFQRRLFSLEDAKMDAGIRLEYLDLNKGKIKETGQIAGDEVKSLTFSLCFRPVSQTAVKINYTYLHNYDLLRNPASKTAGIQVGVASYF